MTTSNISVRFNNSGTIYVINEDEQLGLRFFLDRDTGKMRYPERKHFIHKITEDGKLGDPIRIYGETRKSFDKLREDGWELPWEDDANVSFLRNEDDTATINKLVTPTPEPVPAPTPTPIPEEEPKPPVSDELPITPKPTPTPEPVPAPVPVPEEETPIPDVLPPTPIPDLDEVVYKNDWEPLEKTATLTGDFSLQFWEPKYTGDGFIIDYENKVSTSYVKEYLGGSLSFTTDNSFTVNAPVYSNYPDAYEIPLGMERDISSWKIPSDAQLFSLGTLTYRNDELEDNDSRSKRQHPLDINLTLNDPVAASYSLAIDHSLHFSITNRDDSEETIRLDRAVPSKAHQLRFTDGVKESAPIRFDFAGARQVGASKNTPLQYSFDVPDNTTAQFELFGRLYTTSEPILKNSITVERLDGAEIFNKHQAAGATDYVPANTRGEKAYIFAEFDPNFDLTIEQAAELTGYDHFNWYQVTTSDTDGRLKNLYPSRLGINYPLTDPPGGKAVGTGQKVDNYPYYLDEDASYKRFYENPIFNLNGNFNFRDRPTVEPILSGINPGNVSFETYFVGVSEEDPYLSEALFNFDWSSNFNPDLPPTYSTTKNGWGEVTIGNTEYTLGSPETSFYADDIFLNETGGGGFVGEHIPLPITPTPESNTLFNI